MKRIIFPFFVIFAMALSNAQEPAVQNQISKGTTVIEFNTGLNGLGEFSIMQGSTAFQFSSFEDVSIYNFGFDGGHFIQDGLALKFGLGYGGYSFKDDYVKTIMKTTTRTHFHTGLV